MSRAGSLRAKFVVSVEGIEEREISGCIEIVGESGRAYDTRSNAKPRRFGHMARKAACAELEAKFGQINRSGPQGQSISSGLGAIWGDRDLSRGRIQVQQIVDRQKGQFGEENGQCGGVVPFGVLAAELQRRNQTR